MTAQEKEDLEIKLYLLTEKRQDLTSLSNGSENEWSQ